MATVTGTSTVDTFLMKKDTSDYKKVVDIINYPDLGGDPEAIDVTTLSDHARRSIPGIQEVEALAFEVNYTPENYAAVKALEDVETDYSVWFGRGTDKQPDGHDGKFNFTGAMTAYVVGGGVNEARKINCVITPSSEIELAST